MANNLPDPITRVEQYLNEIAENTSGGGGGGGGSSLPAVTAEDNGDVLTVVEGQWAKAAPSGGGGVLVVNADMQTMALDKTWQEIVDAGFSVLLLPGGDETTVLWLATYGVVYPSDVAAWEVIYYSPELQLTFTATSASGYPVLQIDGGGE